MTDKFETSESFLYTFWRNIAMECLTYLEATEEITWNDEEGHWYWTSCGDIVGEG